VKDLLIRWQFVAMTTSSMCKTIVQSRRTKALLVAHKVLVRFGGRAGTLLDVNDEVRDYVKANPTPGQNLYAAMFYVDDTAEHHLKTALKKDLGDIIEANAGPLGVSGPRLQRMLDGRITWSRHKALRFE